MPGDWIVPVASLVGGLLGGAIGAYGTHVLAVRRSVREERYKADRDDYALLEQFVTALSKEPSPVSVKGTAAVLDDRDRVFELRTKVTNRFWLGDIAVLAIEASDIWMTEFVARLGDQCTGRLGTERIVPYTYAISNRIDALRFVLKEMKKQLRTSPRVSDEELDRIAKAAREELDAEFPVPLSTDEPAAEQPRDNSPGDDTSS